MPASRKRLTGAVALAVIASGLLLVPTASQANPAGTGIVISEVYGGGGNGGAVYRSDFVELYNPTSSPVSLNGMSLQYRAEAGATAVGSSNKTDLSGTIPANGYFLVKQADGANTALPALPTPDQSGSIAIGGTGGQMFLSSGTTLLSPGTGNMAGAAGVVDMVGWGSATGGTYSYEGTAKAAATANGTSTRRNATNTDTDSNSADFSTGTPSPTNSGPGTSTPLEAASPGSRSGTVGLAIAGFSLSASGGTPPYTWAFTDLPPGVNGNAGGAVSGTPTTAGTYNVTATVTDGASASDPVSFTFTVDAAPELTTIAEVQGTGARSPYAPATGNSSGTEAVTVEGVVTARYPAGGFNGMYIQSPGADTEDASDGIFVYAGGGNNNIPAGITVGDSVRVTGPVAEFFDLTQIVPTSASNVVELGTSLGTITPRAIGYPTTTEAREVREGELLAPTGDFTVSNNFQTNQFAEIGLAAGTSPLRQWTEFASPHDVAGINAIKADNAERAVILDDGSTINYLQNQTNKAIPLPWLTPSNSPRVGAAVTFTGPVILDWRNNNWKFQPDHQVTGDGTEVATFEDTRADNLVPRPVGGDLTIATFNVLNYFNTTGEAYADSGELQNPPIVTHCTYFTDRQSNRIGNDQCGVKQPGETYTSSNPNDGRGPRGAATAASLARQEEKLANTINTLDADIIGLEEVENSIKLPGESNRDDALARIVEIVNAAAGEQKWAYVKSPGEALTASAVAEQDVIRGAFIYQRDRVQTVGQSDLLLGTTQFANAREPLAQAFKAKGAPDSDAFAVIVNHFKSKGDNASPTPPATGDNANDPDTGVGAFNGDRVRQAQRLVEFADEFAADRDIEAVFLAGDFNAYTMEDPITTLEAGGYELVDSTDADDESYSFSGLSGSLDHVLGNEAAVEMVTGADIWEINADEPVAYQYSRYNYNATILFDATLPFATSDHNPEIVGIDVPEFEETTYREIQVLGTNDFHGRLLPDGGNAAGAAPFATAVKELKSEIPDSIFVAAGDLVGASTFESFIQDDEPTIDALNAMDLEVSAAGNHEFDRGYDDFVGRIQDLAQWEYIAANVVEPAGQDELAETFTKTFGSGSTAVEVGFVGAVTEDLPALVNPDGIEGVTVTDVVDATNAAAADLKADGADLVVLLVHEGSPSTVCGSDSFTDPGTTWGNIVQNTSADVDAIISGHTHLAYNCRFTVEDWATEGRAVTKRPVVSAGQYGTNLNQLVFKYDTTSGELAAISQEVVATAGVGYAPDPEVQQIVDDAVEYAETAGAEVLGKMTGPFNRARYLPASGATENRGGESTLGNQVAEVQRWATDSDLAFMNPGGLRADMVGTANGSVRDLTYRQAADVQPFANTLVNMQLTGAQIETVLEQQWQRNAQGGVPSRPFLRLGVSEGFTYTYVETPETVSVPNAPSVDTFQGEVTGMWLDGEPIAPGATYSVTVNSFLASGGDNFWELAEGADIVDTGKIDLEAMVDYMAQYATDALPVDYSQRAVEVTFPAGAPETYEEGGTVAFDVASWAMSAVGDAQDTTISVQLDGVELGTATVDNTIGTTPYDSYGTASVSVTLPADLPGDSVDLTLVGEQTGTSVPVTLAVDDGIRDVQILATNDFHGRLLQDGANSAGAAVLSGAVKQLRAENPHTVFAAAGDLIGASTFESFIQDDIPTIDALNEAGLEVSAVGNHEFDAGYEDLVGRVQDRAEWEYIATNVEEPTGRDELAESWTRSFDGVEVGFVGAVTEELPSLVSPDGIAGVTVTDIVTAVNDEATRLRTEDGVDLVVALVHEGSPSTNCATMTNPATVWGNIVTGLNADVDALVSGHTHLAYNCSFPVADWVSDGRAVTERPVVSAGQYGTFLNQLEFSIDSADGEVVAKQQAILPLLGPDPDGSGPGQPPALYPADPAVAEIVADAVEVAAELGAEVLGQIEAPFARAKYSNGTTENRGGESTLGNLVAEVQRWATPATVGSAEIAFMNPGGLRADMVGTVNGGVRDLTYRQAANVQPFANTLVNMDLTGAQIETVLEQQWQRTSAGAVPTRPFLRLGTSDGFTYTYTQRTDPAFPTQKLGEVTGMWLDGDPVDPAATYSVTVNSFLASGGDNFRELANGTAKQDTGITDLQAMVEYMAEFGSGGQALPVDYAQHAVDVTFPVTAPATYSPGDTVEFDLASLSMTDPSDLRDTQVEVRLDGAVLGTFPVTTTISAPTPDGSNSNDDAGTADVSVVIPAGTQAGVTELTVVGTSTGTQVRVPIEVEVNTTGVSAQDVSVTYGKSATVEVRLDPTTARGTVQVLDGTTVLGSASVGSGGIARVRLPARSLEPGQYQLTASYSGNSTHPPGSDTFQVTVAKAGSTVYAAAIPPIAKMRKTEPVLLIAVDGDNDVLATGTVRVTAPGQPVQTAELWAGFAVIELDKFTSTGTKTVTIEYLGSDRLEASSENVSIVVIR